MEHLSTYRLDLEQYYLGEKPNDANMPTMAYDWDSAQKWREALKANSLGERTIYTLHSVNGQVPMRWLAGIAETAQLIEGIREKGYQPPESWVTMAPIHINTAANIDPRSREELEVAVQEGMTNAQFLGRVAHGYLDRFHPSVPKPEIEYDSIDAALRILSEGDKASQGISPEGMNTLLNMSSKHARSGDPRNGAASYLLAHYDAYGLTYGETEAGLFKPKNNPLFVLPQSEDTFINLMEQERNNLRGHGALITLAESNAITLMSKNLRTPHYYPHNSEPLLVDGVLLTDGMLAHSHVPHGAAFTEILHATNLIRKDIGGGHFEGELSTIIQNSL